MAEGVSLLIKQHSEKFTPKTDGLIFKVGTGFGAGRFFVISSGNKRWVRFELSEMGTIPSKGPGSPDLEESGASIRGILNAFTDALPANKCNAAKKQEILDTENAKIATDLEEARKYFPGLIDKEFDVAAAQAANKFLDPQAYLASLKINDGVNLVIIAGKIAPGVKGFINSHPGLFENDIQNYKEIVQPYMQPELRNLSRTVFDQVFLSKIWNCLARPKDESEFRLSDGQTQFQIRGFDIVSNLDITDNTVGGPYLAQAITDVRSDRLMIPEEVFRTNSSTPSINSTGYQGNPSFLNLKTINKNHALK